MRAPGGARAGEIAWVLCLTIAVAGATASVCAKRKDDRVVLLNGDRLVGEIKELAQGYGLAGKLGI